MEKSNCRHEYNPFFNCMKLEKRNFPCKKCYKIFKRIKRYTCSFRSVGIIKQVIDRQKNAYYTGTAIYTSSNSTTSTTMNLNNIHDHVFCEYMGGTETIRFLFRLSFLAHFFAVVLFIFFMIAIGFFGTALETVAQIVSYGVIFSGVFLVLSIGTSTIKPDENAMARYATAELKERNGTLPSHIVEEKMTEQNGRKTNVHESTAESDSVMAVKLLKWNTWLSSLSGDANKESYLLNDEDILYRIIEDQKKCWANLFSRKYKIQLKENNYAEYTANEDKPIDNSIACQASLAQSVISGITSEENKIRAINAITDKNILMMLSCLNKEQAVSSLLDAQLQAIGVNYRYSSVLYLFQ